MIGEKYHNRSWFLTLESVIMEGRLMMQHDDVTWCHTYRHTSILTMTSCLHIMSVVITYRQVVGWSPQRVCPHKNKCHEVKRRGSSSVAVSTLHAKGVGFSIKFCQGSLNVNFHLYKKGCMVKGAVVQLNQRLNCFLLIMRVWGIYTWII